MSKDTTGIVILAAGKSSRMGSPKQILVFEKMTLLQRVIGVCTQVTKSDYVRVVLGASYSDIEVTIRDMNVPVCLNNNWESGMASSIKTGLLSLLNDFPALKKCIFLVCDQPFLSSEVLQEMIDAHLKSSKGIVVAEYAETLGVPVLFTKKYFQLLMNLEGDQGAKKIIFENLLDVEKYTFNKGSIDIDTISDFKKLTKYND